MPKNFGSPEEKRRYDRAAKQRQRTRDADHEDHVRQYGF